MENKAKSWLQLYVDAMTERDPYKRLALVRELRNIPRDVSDELGDGPTAPSSRKSKLTRRH